MFDPRNHCRWCTGSPGLEQCTCKEPCRANLCPMRDNGSLYHEDQPVPTFERPALEHDE